MATSAEDFRALIEYLNTLDEDERRRKKHRLRMECYSANDCEFFITVCARHHGTPFRDPGLARAVVDALLWRREHHHWILFCYCLMPDHLHFLVRLTEEPARLVNAGARGTVLEGLIEQVGAFKSYTTTQVWWKRCGQGLLWQKSSYDRGIRYNQSIDAPARYILENPVRKGLAASWDAYPYSAIVDAWG